MEVAVRPDRRLLWALGASVAVHAAAVSWVRGPSQWSLRWPSELPRVLEVAMRALPDARPEPAPMAPPPARRTAESRPSARAPSTTAHPPTPVLTAPAAAPATEFRVPAAPALPAAPQAAPAAAPTRAPPADAPVTAPRFDADYLENPPPAYPLAARRRGLQGTVRIEVLVARDGRVRDLKVDEGSGHPELDEAALRAVREWRFVPARRGGDPVEASVIVPVRFQLDRR